MTPLIALFLSIYFSILTIILIVRDSILYTQAFVEEEAKQTSILLFIDITATAGFWTFFYYLTH